MPETLIVMKDNWLNNNNAAANQAAMVIFLGVLYSQQQLTKDIVSPIGNCIQLYSTSSGIGHAFFQQ